MLRLETSFKCIFLLELKSSLLTEIQLKGKNARLSGVTLQFEVLQRLSNLLVKGQNGTGLVYFLHY